MNILVVDDSKAMRLIVTRHLRRAGYESATIREAGDGAEAIAAVQQSCPDVVLCDWNMPGMSGLELLRHLRGAGVGVPFGFVTSEGSDEVIGLAREAGASFLVTKPFTAEVLAQALGGVLGAAR